MFISSFTVKDCLYLSNTSISSIQATLTETMQLILGSNGSGKTVLCGLLTGYPPKPKSFKSGGFMELTGYVGIVKYTIRYDITKNVKCTFIREVEGVVSILNDKGTTTVQKDLLHEHLGIDQDIFKLMTGKAKFTNMSANERKRWIDKVSPIDMTYITGIYDRVRRSARDIKGAIKVNTDRMHREVTRLDAMGLPDDIEQEYEAINNRFLALTKEHDAYHPTTEAITAKILTLDEKVTSSLGYIADLRTQSNRIKIKHSVVTFTELDERITELRVTNEHLIKEAEEHAVTITEYESAMRDYAKYDGDELRLLNETRDEAKARIDDLEARYPDGLPFMLAWSDTRVVSMLPTIESTVRKLITDMPNNSKPDWYSSTEVTALSNRRDTLRNEVHATNLTLSEMSEKLRQMESARLIDCPKCDHSFHKGFTTQDKDNLKERIDVIGKDVLKVKLELEQVESKLGEVDVYRESLTIYNTARKTLQIVSGFWSVVEQGGYLGVNPSMMNEPFMELKRVLGDIFHYDKMKTEFARVDTILERLGKNDSTGLAGLTVRHEALVALRESKLDTAERNRHECNELHGFRRLAFEQGELLASIEEDCKRIEELYLTLASAAHHDLIREEVEGLMGRLATVRELVNKKQVLNGVIQGIKDQLAEIEEQESDWRALTAVLSPEHGLIAKQVNSYIGGFITLMNQTINSVWTYVMEVQPCSVEQGGLNYLFPVHMPSKRSSPDDVSECSDGQSDMINFAFLTAVMRCLELDDLPYFLDELGKTFDEEHAVRLMAHLNRLLDSGRCRQMFMVNHFQAMHGSLKNAEVLVLDEDNVTAPVSSNSHVTFNGI